MPPAARPAQGLSRPRYPHTFSLFAGGRKPVPALAVWTAFDGLLSAVAPLGLAAAAGTALVVDLDPAGPPYPGRNSLAGLAPLVPVWPLLPGILAPRAETQCVYQRTGFAATPPGPGPVLPRLRPTVLAGLLNGMVAGRSRWVAAWRQVWRLPWR